MESFVGSHDKYFIVMPVDSGREHGSTREGGTKCTQGKACAVVKGYTRGPRLLWVKRARATADEASKNTLNPSSTSAKWVSVVKPRSNMIQYGTRTIHHVFLSAKFDQGVISFSRATLIFQRSNQ